MTSPGPCLMFQQGCFFVKEEGVGGWVVVVVVANGNG